MLDLISRRWWVLLLRGLAAIAVGIMAIIWPGLTVWALVLLFALFALSDGIASVAMGIAGGGRRHWFEMVLLGVVSIGAGIIALAWPGLTAMALLFLIAFDVIVRGVLEIVAAIRLRSVIHDEWVLMLSGLLSIGFGVLLLVRPGAGALAVVLLIGCFMIAMGMMAVALSLRLKGLHGDINTPTGRFRPA